MTGGRQSGWGRGRGSPRTAPPWTTGGLRGRAHCSSRWWGPGVGKRHRELPAVQQGLKRPSAPGIPRHRVAPQRCLLFPCRPRDLPPVRAAGAHLHLVLFPGVDGVTAQVLLQIRVILEGLEQGWVSGPFLPLRPSHGQRPPAGEHSGRADCVSRSRPR